MLGARTVVSVNAATVQVGDVVVIGGERFEIRDMTTVQGGMKRLSFAGGGTLTLPPTTPFRCERPLRRRRTAGGGWPR